MPEDRGLQLLTGWSLSSLTLTYGTAKGKMKVAKNTWQNDRRDHIQIWQSNHFNNGWAGP